MSKTLMDVWDDPALSKLRAQRLVLANAIRSLPNRHPDVAGLVDELSSLTVEQLALERKLREAHA